MEIMTNGQMGISSFERNGFCSSNYFQNPFSLQFFPNSAKPIFGISLNTKRAHYIRIYSLKLPNHRTTNASSREDSKNQSVNGGFIEKEFRFQPTFDEYLKAMESVRTVREKNPIQDANKYYRKNGSKRKDLQRTTILEGDEENVKLGEFEAHSHQLENANSMEQDELSEKFSRGTRGEGVGRGNLVYRKSDSRGLKDRSKQEELVERLSETGNVGNDLGLDPDKLDIRVGDMDIKVRRAREGDRDNRGLERKNVRWMKSQASVVERKFGESGFSKITKDRRKHGSFGKSDAVKQFSGNLDLGGSEMGHNGSSMEMQKKQLNRNQKSNAESMKFYRTNTERRLGECEVNQSLNYSEHFYRNNVQRKLGEAETNEVKHEKELFSRSKVESKVEGSEITDSIMEEKRSHGNQRRFELNCSAFETKKLGPRSTETRRSLAGYKVPMKSLKFTKGSKTSTENVDGNSLEMERAAFKSFEVFTDVRDRPRVLRMEMEERIQNLAKWLNGTDINLPEWLFSKMMHSAKIRFTDHSILRVIQILGTLGNWRRVLQVIEWLQSRERFKSHKMRYIYTAALDVLGKAKRPVEALNVFHAMQKQLSSYPDLAAYHCIAVTLGQAGHMKELFDVIDCMRSPPQKKFKTGVLEKWDPRLEPDVVVYNAVLNACVRRKQWEGAFWVLQQLKEQGLKPSSTTYGLVMEVMFTCGKYNLVHEFFKKVEKSSLPNTLNYKVLVNTLWREGRTDEAVLAVQDMERRGIVSSASLYYDLARCLCSAGRCQEALMQIDKICKVANKPLVITYTGLIQACLDSGSVQNGAYIFNQMHKFCSPNLVTCNIMLKAYLQNGMFEEAKDLFQKMSDNINHISTKNDYMDRVIPDNHTFNTMLDACLAEKKWDDLEYVYRRMLLHGYHFNTKHHLRMITEACSAGKGELIEATWKHLAQAGQVPPPAIIKEWFFMKLEEDNYGEAISCIISRRTSEVHAFSEKTWLNLFTINAHRFRKDTFVRLIHELSTLLAGNDHPHPTLRHLMTSCRKFITAHTAAEINTNENVRSVCGQSANS